MVLGVDASRLAGARVGVGRNYEMLVRSWARQDMPFERVKLFSPVPLTDLPGGDTPDPRFEIEVLPAAGPGLWWQLSRLRHRAPSVDVLLAPYTLPPGYPGRAVVSNHGLLEGSYRVPGALARARSHHFRYSALRANAVIANTSATKMDLVRFYGIPEEKITVIRPGIDPSFRPARASEEGLGETAAERLLGTDDPFFLFVGKLSLRRHVGELLDAFAQATARRSRGPRYRLLLAGPNLSGIAIEGIAAGHGIGDRVHHFEFIDGDTLALLYRGARALLMPSEKESFSRPIAEAMASGCPVLTLKGAPLGVLEYVNGASDHSAGGPVLEADDPSAASMAEPLRRLAEDDELCALLRERGLRCAATFASPAEQAQRTMAVLAEVARAMDGAQAGERDTPPRGSERGRLPESTDVERFWDEMAARYDRDQDSMLHGGQMGSARTEAVLRLLGDGPGDVLDAGMGPGRLLAELADRGWAVTGVDLSEEMVALARRRLPAARDRLMKGEIEALPYPDESFGAVVGTGVLEYVGYRARALEEIARVLRPRGLAVVSIPLRRTDLRRSWRLIAGQLKRVVPFGRPIQPLGLRPPDREGFERMMEAAGLSVSSAQPVRAGRVAQIVFAARKHAEGELDRERLD